MKSINFFSRRNFFVCTVILYDGLPPKDSYGGTKHAFTNMILYWRSATIILSSVVIVPPPLDEILNETLIITVCRSLEVPASAQKLADEKNFEIKMYRIGAASEQVRPPRLVRVAVVQNGIVRPTTDPVKEQVRYTCTCTCT